MGYHGMLSRARPATTGTLTCSDSEISRGYHAPVTLLGESICAAMFRTLGIAAERLHNAAAAGLTSMPRRFDGTEKHDRRSAN
jgi:hypothetical protein